MSDNGLARVESGGLTVEALPLTDLVEQVRLIQEIMRDVMKENEHYGVIPGTGKKPTLLKPGAEKLGFVFRLAPEFVVEERDLGAGHREYKVTCRLLFINSGRFAGSGVGLCSTLETKYRYRSGKRKCPECHAEAIIQTKKGRNPGGYWCVPDKGGCGANFDPGDPDVENQQLGKVENPDLADTFNTVLKMAKKRAHVDAILTATAASDIFTQDIEDLPAAPLPADVVEPAAVEAAPARSKAPAKLPASNAAAMPANGKELYERLNRFDRNGADKHYFKPGALVTHVMDYAAKKGFPEEFARWEQEHIADAVREAKAFLDEKRAYEEAKQKPVPEVTSA